MICPSATRLSDDTGAAQGFERANWRGLAAVIASSLIIGVGLGGAMPLLSLKLEAWGVPSVMIGLNAAMSPLGAITGSFFVPLLLRRFSPAGCMAFGILCGATVLLLFGLTDDLPAWFALRFFFGLAVALPWVVGEAWINAVATDAVRGRVMAYYATALAGGFMLGPLALTVIGSQGLAPFVFIAGKWRYRLADLVGAPLAPIYGSITGSAFSMIWVAPTIFVTAARKALGRRDFLVFADLRAAPWPGRGHRRPCFGRLMAGNVVLQIPWG